MLRLWERISFYSVISIVKQFLQCICNYFVWCFQENYFFQCYLKILDLLTFVVTIFFIMDNKRFMKGVIYPSNKFNHLSTTSSSILPSNIWISKLTCTLKGVVPSSDCWMKMHCLFPFSKGSRQSSPSSRSFSTGGILRVVAW